MALKKAGAPAVLPDEMPEVPTSIPRDRWDRPLIVPPGGGRPTAYTRASTLGKTIEDTYHLSRWAQRNVALGLSRRPDLVALAAAVATNEGDDRAALDEIADKAHEAAKGDRGANVGTALHKLSERRDAGEDLSYLPADLAAAMDAYSRTMAPFEVLASETFVVHDGLQAAGSFDRMLSPRAELVAPDGTRFGPGDVITADLKTSKAESAQHWGSTYAVQQTVYAHGVPYQPKVGRRRWQDILGLDALLSRDWALILHVPSDSPADAGLVWVNLTIGAALAELCVDVRRARKVKGLFAECHVTVPVASCEGCGKAEHATADCPRPFLTCEYCNYDKHTCPGCGESLTHRGPKVCAECHATAPAAMTPQEAANAAIEAGPASAAEPDHAERIAAAVPAVAPGGNTKPVPAQVRKALLMASLRQAPDEAALDTLWEQHQDDWAPEHTQMVRVRLQELATANARMGAS